MHYSMEKQKQKIISPNSEWINLVFFFDVKLNFMKQKSSSWNLQCISYLFWFLTNLLTINFNAVDFMFRLKPFVSSWKKVHWVYMPFWNLKLYYYYLLLCHLEPFLGLLTVPYASICQKALGGLHLSQSINFFIQDFFTVGDNDFSHLCRCLKNWYKYSFILYRYI